MSEQLYYAFTIVASNEEVAKTNFYLEEGTFVYECGPQMHCFVRILSPNGGRRYTTDWQFHEENDENFPTKIFGYFSIAAIEEISDQIKDIEGLSITISLPENDKNIERLRALKNVTVETHASL